MFFVWYQLFALGKANTMMSEFVDIILSSNDRFYLKKTLFFACCGWQKDILCKKKVQKKKALITSC